MGNAYSVNAGVACGTDLPIINLTGSASVVVKIYDIIVGFSGSPADVSTILMVERTTDVGTGGTGLSEVKADPLTATPTGAGIKGTFSAAPTDTDELLKLAINQRANQRWVAFEGRELRSTAAANNGIMLNSESSTATPTCEATIFWME